MCFLLYKAVSCDYFLFPVFIIWMWFKQHVYQQIRVGLSPNWVWCCCPKNLFSSWHSGETNRSKSPRLQRNHLYWRQVSKAINIECAWLQTFWSGCTLLCCATVTRRQLCTTKKIQKKFLSTPWAYFRNGPNAAATSVAPTLIRHCSRQQIDYWQNLIAESWH